MNNTMQEKPSRLKLNAAFIRWGCEHHFPFLVLDRATGLRVPGGDERWCQWVRQASVEHLGLLADRIDRWNAARSQEVSA